MDIDSLLYEIERQDLYNYMSEMKGYMDLFTFGPTNTYYQPEFGANIALVPKMKHEATGTLLFDFGGLLPTVDSFKMVCRKDYGTLDGLEDSVDGHPSIPA